MASLYVGQSIHPFCNKVKRDPLETECTDDRSSVALCNLVRHVNELPSHFQVSILSRIFNFLKLNINNNNNNNSNNNNNNTGSPRVTRFHVTRSSPDARFSNIPKKFTLRVFDPFSSPYAEIWRFFRKNARKFRKKFNFFSNLRKSGSKRQ